jgi:soluble lytic murein transglycosylase-like protein
MAIPNVNQITSTLRNMPDQQLQQYAAMHKTNPYVLSLAVAESNDRKALRASQQAQMAGQKQPTVADQAVMGMAAQDQLPEQRGIGALPAPNMQNMADGGIAGYGEDSSEQIAYNNEPVIRMAEGGVARFADRGAVQGSPEQYRAYALKRAEELGLDPMFVDSVFNTEYRYKHDAKSPTGPVGIGQLTKATAKAYGLDPKERTDPYKNIDASLRFMTDLNKKYGGDKSKMAVAYNQGEPYLDRHLRENQGQIVPAKLSVEPQNYLNKTVRRVAEGVTGALIPSAVAGEVPNQAAPQAQTSEPRRAITGNQGLIGAGETALQYMTGLAAIPTAGGAAVLGQVPNILSGKGADRAEMERSFREKAGQVTYEPRTEGGRAVSEGFAKTLEDLKIPPYLAHMGNLSPKQGRAGIPASELEALAAQKTRMAETPRLAGPGSAETMVQGRGQPPVKNGAAVARQLADIDEAKAWRDTVLSGKASQGTESTRPEIITRNAELARAQGIAAAASPAATAGTYVQPEPTGETALNKMMGDPNAPDNIDVGGGFNPASGKGDKETEKAATGKSPNSRFSDDDLLMLGLGMMANNKPGTGNKFGDLLASAGQAGIGAIGAKREREKQEVDTLYKTALAKNYGVDPIIQRLNALQDPKIAAAYARMKELDREPQTRETVAKQWMASPFLQMQYPKLDDYLRMAETAMSGQSGITAPKLSPDQMSLIQKYTG